MSVSEFLIEVSGDPSNKGKDKKLNEYVAKNDPSVLKIIVLLAYDVAKTTFGIKAWEKVAMPAEGMDSIDFSKMPEQNSEWTELAWATALKSNFDRLASRAVSGNDAEKLVQYVWGETPADYQWIVEGIVDRDLGIGVGRKTWEKLFPKLLYIFGCALAEEYKRDKAPSFALDTWYASRKMDGVRCLVVVDPKEGVAYSREGRPFPTAWNRVVEDLVELAQRHFDSVAGSVFASGGKIVFDGEMCVVDENGKEDFKQASTAIKIKGHTEENPKFIVFDILTLEELNDKRSKVRLSERWARWEAYAFDHSPYAELCPQIKVRNQEHLEELFAEAVDKGFEGLIVRKDTGYNGTRSKDLQKVKLFKDAEFVITRTENGPRSYKEAEGQVVREVLRNAFFTYKGVEAKAGAGRLTKKEILHYAEHPEDLIGKVVTIQYFEETTNKNGGGGMRFPTIKFVHGDERIG